MSSNGFSPKNFPRAPDQVVEPIKRKKRIQALDVIRGVSILGILPVNVDGFAAPKWASLNPNLWFFPNEGSTAISYWIMQTGFHEKFISMFSMLFGVSLFLVGGELSDKQRGRILARRFAVLFLFGLLHGFLIWWGDILSLYAVTGAIMFFCRSWHPKRLMIIGVTLFVSMTLCHPIVSNMLKHSVSGPVANITNPEKLMAQKAHVTQALAEAKGSWVGAFKINIQSYIGVLTGYPVLLPSTLGLMMVGLSLFKSGFLAAKSTDQIYIRTIACAAPLFIAGAWFFWQEDLAQKVFPGAQEFVELSAPIVALGYASLLILALKAGKSTFLFFFAATGRMAFTNYLTQSLIMTSIFYGGRGALMGEVDRPTLWLIVIAIWGLQLVWSHHWLDRFEMGPFEWIWRCFTFGRRVPMLRLQKSI
jgi:uncharacterized protein